MRNFVTANMGPSPHKQGREKLPNGNIKTLGRVLSHHICFRQIKLENLGIEMIQHSLVFHHRTFGHTCGPGSVNRVCQIIGRVANRQIFLGSFFSEQFFES